MFGWFLIIFGVITIIAFATGAYQTVVTAIFNKAGGSSFAQGGK